MSYVSQGYDLWQSWCFYLTKFETTMEMDMFARNFLGYVSWGEKNTLHVAGTIPCAGNWTKLKAEIEMWVKTRPFWLKLIFVRSFLMVIKQ